ncbi:hypothetical protein G9F73_015430 [Clostridium estertheticum]|uniref:hypothetical protein n=1 Tax=Clostridium estertheticum TaxID=238834 RepID=UPI001CCB1D1A|nr:hypothetical protein [Clostridium estertheticum]MBZ9609183.1 hypothetical protein [Clostridium estertheticum]
MSAVPDGSIIYDFETNKTIICDIDFYTKNPFINTMGHMWGSSRFMSPEEFEKGATIDEITNVFTMGAMAFEILGNNYNHNIEQCKASKTFSNTKFKLLKVFSLLQYSIHTYRSERLSF